MVHCLKHFSAMQSDLISRPSRLSSLNRLYQTTLVSLNSKIFSTAVSFSIRLQNQAREPYFSRPSCAHISPKPTSAWLLCLHLPEPLSRPPLLGKALLNFTLSPGLSWIPPVKAPIHLIDLHLRLLQVDFLVFSHLYDSLCFQLQVRT